jgi:hypothetical protein
MAVLHPGDTDGNDVQPCREGQGSACNAMWHIVLVAEAGEGAVHWGQRQEWWQQGEPSGCRQQAAGVRAPSALA